MSPGCAAGMGGVRNKGKIRYTYRVILMLYTSVCVRAHVCAHISVFFLFFKLPVYCLSPTD